MYNLSWEFSAANIHTSGQEGKGSNTHVRKPVMSSHHSLFTWRRRLVPLDFVFFHHWQLHSLLSGLEQGVSQAQDTVSLPELGHGFLIKKRDTWQMHPSLLLCVFPPLFLPYSSYLIHIATFSVSGLIGNNQPQSLGNGKQCLSAYTGWQFSSFLEPPVRDLQLIPPLLKIESCAVDANY